WVYHNLAHLIYWAVDRGVIDNLYHAALPWAFSKISAAFRRLQTGSLSWYLLYAIAGSLVLILLVLL
ncbi:MAG: NADH-quinone oxidoreductase subunit L, partial [Thermoproteus sp.]